MFTACDQPTEMKKKDIVHISVWFSLYFLKRNSTTPRRFFFFPLFKIHLGIKAKDGFTMHVIKQFQ